MTEIWDLHPIAIGTSETDFSQEDRPRESKIRRFCRLLAGRLAFKVMRN